MQRHDARVGHAGQLLAALSYRGVLARGFALVRDAHGATVRAAAAVAPGADLTLEFADGRLAATAEGRAAESSTRPGQPKPASEPKPPAPKRAMKPIGQGSLF
jgi:exodeoxyribonuclease VII large subunit